MAVPILLSVAAEIAVKAWQYETAKAADVERCLVRGADVTARIS